MVWSDCGDLNGADCSLADPTDSKRTQPLWMKVKDKEFVDLMLRGPEKGRATLFS